MIRLSFIVPFYNVEPYIEECIRSLYAQDIPQEEYEVICVDDCSPDGSRAIVERLQREYTTLQLLSCPFNMKQGGARNLGMKEAKGEYVWFVDSDDCIMPNVLTKILNDAERNSLQILQFAYLNGEKMMSCSDKEIQSGEEYLFNNTEKISWVYKVMGPWRQIYLRFFLNSHDFTYIENVQYEDTDYVLKAFVAADRVAAIDEAVYIYRKNDSSTTHDSKVDPQKLAWQINQYARCADLINSISLAKGRTAVENMIYNSLFSLRADLKRFSGKQKYVYRKNLCSKVYKLRPIISWRTWLAIRYGITWFI